MQSLPYQRDFGDTAVFPLPYRPEPWKAILTPARGFDIGAGPGKTLEATVEGGVVGLIVDCRGRQPFEVPEETGERVAWLTRWMKALDAYPDMTR